ncbi:MAG: hypothetical protein JNL82_04550 [Myxococcales bacterium]|nr:hypothetical protein [Myxococcales bacterium]
MGDRGEHGSGWSRRGLFAAVGAGLWSLAGPAAAADGKKLGPKVQAIDQGRRGTTITLALEHGMFPAPGKRYQDATTLVFVPGHFRVMDDQKVDAVVHFHGHRTTAGEAMVRHQLREQLDDSRQNAILVMPQGPVRRSDSSGGNLDKPGGFQKFLGEVRSALQGPAVAEALGPSRLPHAARIGMVCVSAHSGGFGVTARCIKHGGFNIAEVYLFDALYGEVAAFADWVGERRDQQGAERHKLVCYYTGGKVRSNSLTLLRELRRQGIDALHEEREGQLSRAQITRARAVFIKTRDHMRVTYKSNSLRDCLYASGLKRRLESDWFANKDEQRAIERRE